MLVDFLHALILISESLWMTQWLIGTFRLPGYISAVIDCVLWNLLNISGALSRASVMRDTINCVINPILRINPAFSVAN